MYARARASMPRRRLRRFRALRRPGLVARIGARFRLRRLSRGWRRREPRHGAARIPCAAPAALGVEHLRAALVARDPETVLEASSDGGAPLGVELARAHGVARAERRV